MSLSTISPPALDALGDSELLRQLGELVCRDQQHTAQLLRQLDEVDRRQLWAKHGHPSMFDFCVVRFNMSESMAGKRIGAARTARRFTVLFDMVARGEIHLSGIHRLKTHLTEDNHARVLACAKHKTIKQIERLVAELFPQPDVPSRLRGLPRRSLASQASSPKLAPVASSPRSDAATPMSPTQPTAANTFTRTLPRSPNPTPLSPRRYKLEVTLDEEAHADLVQLQDLLAHRLFNGDPAAIVSRALSVLLADDPKEKGSADGHAARRDDQDQDVKAQPLDPRGDSP